MLKRLWERLAPLLIAAILWAVYRTTRRVRVNWHIVEQSRDRGEPVIVACWHNDIAYFVVFLGRHTRLSAITSKSRDGDAIARIAAVFGMGNVRGSTSRAALSALRESVRVLRERWVGITPDGPRGPRYVVQDGAAGLAQLSGAPVIPVAWAARHLWEFGSWDRMKLPKPFSTVAILAGEPIRVERGEDTEQARLRIERAMRKLTRDADRFVGGTLTEREPLLKGVD